MTFNTDYAGYPNYFPNSFSGPSDAPAALESKFEVSGDVARYNTADDDNFSQVGIYWTKVLDDGAKERLVQNIAGHLKSAQSFIQVMKYMLCNYDVTLLIMKFQIFLGSCGKEFYSSSRRLRTTTTCCS
jgi:catalase